MSIDRLAYQASWYGSFERIARREKCCVWTTESQRYAKALRGADGYICPQRARALQEHKRQ